MKKKIIKNAAKCNICGDVIKSKHTHDFKTCKCGTISVDGGHEYLKRSYKKSRDEFTDLSEFK